MPSPKMMVFVIFVIFLVFLTFSRPEFMILTIILSSSTIFTLNKIPTIKIGYTFSLIEIGLIFLIVLVTVRLLAEKEFHYVKTPLDSPISLFFIISTISLVYSVVILGTDVNRMEYQWRIIFSYLIFFTVTNLIRTRKQLLTLVGGLIVLANFVAILMIIQQILGRSAVILPGRIEVARVYESSYYSVTRILPPGQSLILSMFFLVLLTSITYSFSSNISKLLLLSLLLLATAIAFTFNRGFWAGVVISLAVMIIFISKYQRKNLLTNIIILFIIFIIFIPVIYFAPQHSIGISEAIYARALTFLDPSKIQNSASWQWRMAENEYAKIMISQHPIIGIGPGNDYRPDFFQDGDRLTGYIHNTYYFILLDFGIIGFISFVWFSILFLVRGFSKHRNLKDEFFRSIVLGNSLSFLAILIVGIVAPVFMETYWTPVLGVIFGVNEVIFKLDLESSI
jgi:O-antigen ligase